MMNLHYTFDYELALNNFDDELHGMILLMMNMNFQYKFCYLMMNSIFNDEQVDDGLHDSLDDEFHDELA